MNSSHEPWHSDKPQSPQQPTSQRKPLAYSYLRMSTEEQLKGDSVRRQLEATEKYVSEKGLELVDSMKAIGVSAFRGRNLEFGPLEWFLGQLERERIPNGSFLIVESMDRLSRQNALEAFGLLSRIISHGITLVTLDDRQEYSRASVNENGFQLFIALGAIMRAHNESLRKSQLLAAAWGEKKRRARDGVLATRRLPAWLKWNSQTKEIEPIPERAALVRAIFTWARDGYGSYSIARRLNDSQILPWGSPKKKNVPRIWQESYIQKILSNKAVLGEYQPHRIVYTSLKQKRRMPDGDVITDYYPQIIEDPLFLQAQAAKRARRISGAGRKGETYSNLFTGLLRCSHCGAGYRFLNKGAPPKGHQYLQCSTALGRGDCHAKPIAYHKFENALLGLIVELDVAKIMQAEPDVSSVAVLREDIERLKNDLEREEQVLTNLRKVIEEASDLPPDFIARFGERSAFRNSLAHELAEKVKQLDTLLKQDLGRHQEMIEKLMAAVIKAKTTQERNSLRRNIAADLRTILKEISVSRSLPLAQEIQDEHPDWKRRFGVKTLAALQQKIKDQGYELWFKYQDGRVAFVDMLSGEILSLSASRKMRDLQDLSLLPTK